MRYVTTLLGAALLFAAGYVTGFGDGRATGAAIARKAVVVAQQAGSVAVEYHDAIAEFRNDPRVGLERIARLP